MTTAADMINRSLRLLGVLAEGETPSADTANDALVALNQMLDSWSTEALAVFANTTQAIAWPIGQATISIGPTGSVAGFARPSIVDDATYFHDLASGIDFPLTLVSQDSYNTIANKGSTSSFPLVLYVNVGFPNTELTLYPVPNKPIELRLVSPTLLVQSATLQTAFALPPGYLRAFTYNLAVELAPEFGVDEIPTQVVKTALTSKRNIKRLNTPELVMGMPNMPGMGARSAFDIYSGNF